MSDDLRKQVAQQCRAIVHMATALADVYRDKAGMLDHGADLPLDVVGWQSAGFMEKLGDMLNAMDAVTDEDEWVSPVLERAHELWPPGRNSIAPVQ